MTCEPAVWTYKVCLILDQLEILLCRLHPRRSEHFANLNCSLVLRDPAIYLRPTRTERQHFGLLKESFCILGKTFLKGLSLLEATTFHDHGFALCLKRRERLVASWLHSELDGRPNKC